MNGLRMKKKRDKRRRLFSDFRVQGELIVRIAAYWVVCQLAVVGTFVGATILNSAVPGDEVSVWSLIIPAVVVSSLVLPLVLFDAITFSNRFAGPLLRFRRNLAEFAETGTAENMEFRPGDFYMDLTDSFNKLVSLVDRQKDEPCPSDEPTTETVPPLRIQPMEFAGSVGSESHV